MQLLAYGNTKPVPFQGLITQSTALEPGMSSNISFETTSAVALAAGCNVTDATSTSPDLIECLRALNSTDLFTIFVDYWNVASLITDGDILLPIVDQDFLPEVASDLVSSGKFPKMPLITGWQENDATLFTDPTIETEEEGKAFMEISFPNINSTTMTDLFDLYPVTEFAANVTADLSQEFYRTAEIFRDTLLTCPSVFFGKAMAKQYNTTSPPVYMYSNNQTILDGYLEAAGTPGLGVIHTSELAYMYGNLSIYNLTGQAGLTNYTFDPSASDYELARQFPRSWSTFASTGNPTLAGKNTFQGWNVAFPNGQGDGNVYVIGGASEGMSGNNTAQIKEKLNVRCGFLNTPEIIAQLKY